MSLRRFVWSALVLFSLGCGGAPPPEPVTAAPPPAPSPSPAPATPAAEPAAAARPAEQAAAPAPTAAPPPASDAQGAPKGASVVSERLYGGQLTQAEIREIVIKNAELFDACYTIGAGSSREFVATVTVKATLGPSGTVTATEIVKSNAKNKKVDSCVADAFKKIRFPAPKGGATSVITFPIEFNGVEEVRQ